jgi:hypothetical protein
MLLLKLSQMGFFSFPDNKKTFELKNYFQNRANYKIEHFVIEGAGARRTSSKKFKMKITWRQDTEHKDTEHKDTQHNDTLH